MRSLRTAGLQPVRSVRVASKSVFFAHESGDYDPGGFLRRRRAGGRQERAHGMEKATLRIGDETLLARIVRRLHLALPEVYVVGPLHLAALIPGTAVFPDDLIGIGPLGGLSTALAHAPSRHIFVMGCDMPFVERR